MALSKAHLLTHWKDRSHTFKTHETPTTSEIIPTDTIGGLGAGVTRHPFRAAGVSASKHTGTRPAPLFSPFLEGPTERDSREDRCRQLAWREDLTRGNACKHAEKGPCVRDSRAERARKAHRVHQLRCSTRGSCALSTISCNAGAGGIIKGFARDCGAGDGPAGRSRRELAHRASRPSDANSAREPLGGAKPTAARRWSATGQR